MGSRAFLFWARGKGAWSEGCVTHHIIDIIVFCDIQRGIAFQQETIQCDLWRFRAKLLR
jgi:hypothetical protein